MRATLNGPMMLILGMLVTNGTIGHTQGTGGSWFDEPKIAAWNTAGQPAPSAPKVQDSLNPRCQDLARPPQSEEDTQLRDRGWNLVGAFQGGWQILVIRGAATFDGMCRPMQFQDFVFVRDSFAGTLAPAPMDSRTDGALSRVTLQGPTQLIAEYQRYGKSDALCCPSRVTQVAFDIATDSPVVRARSASTTPTSGTRGSSDQSNTPSAPAGLAGTSWQLVKFEGGDDTVLTPDDRAKYTIEFGADGRLSARIDCNRGRSTWKTDGSSSIEFGPLALTRAMCPAGSLHDQIVKQWGNIRSYVIRDGHLFLSLMADGGIYEFEPAPKSK